jgi:hypothetical protein
VARATHHERASAEDLPASVPARLDAGEHASSPALRVRDSLAARISLLVMLVVLATFTWGFVTLQQLSDMQADFERLVEVYVKFDNELAKAQVQAMRVGEQVRTRSRQRDKPPDPDVLARLPVGLQERARLVVAARVPIDDALRDPQRYGGDTVVAELEQIQGSLQRLQELVELHELEQP